MDHSILYGIKRLREGSWFTMLRMKPTPESSDGAGDARVLVLGVVVTRVAALVWEMLRARLGTGVAAAVARVLLSHVGRSRVIVTFTEWPSSECGVTFRFVGVAAVLRLAGRGGCGTSVETSRVPNLAFADDSRAYAVVGVVVRRAPLETGVLALTTGFWSVTLSAPQYEKLILLFLSESSDSTPWSSSSSGIGTMRGWTPE